MNFEAKRKRISIVLVGEFNPAMFQPEWFARNDIISVEEASIAKDSDGAPLVVTPQITMFKTSMLDVRIEQKRFVVSSQKEPWDLVKDFVGKTFEKLSGMSIKAYGYNYDAHYYVGGAENLNSIGNCLAPKQYWGALFEDDVNCSESGNGLSSMKMLKTKADGNGRVTVMVEPSVHEKNGLFMTCNDHNDVLQDESLAEYVIPQIVESFDATLSSLRKIQEDVITEVLNNV